MQVGASAPVGVLTPACVYLGLALPLGHSLRHALAHGFAFCFGGAALLRLIVGRPAHFPAKWRIAQAHDLPSESVRTRHARTRPSTLSRGESASANYLGRRIFLLSLSSLAAVFRGLILGRASRRHTRVMNTTNEPVTNPKPNAPMISIHIGQTRKPATEGPAFSYLLEFTHWTAVQLALDPFEAALLRLIVGRPAHFPAKWRIAQAHDLPSESILVMHAHWIIRRAPWNEIEGNAGSMTRSPSMISSRWVKVGRGNSGSARARRAS